ncbi:MAG: DnaD domain protein, partial [Clostridia bacterium]|nr:DnaD domain protein [Clostridia bacterium]
DDNVRTVSSSKYSKFSKEIQKVITGRMIGVSEYNAYYDFLERHEGFDWEALVAVAKYCVDYKGNNINYPYVLTVAKAQYQKGNLSAELVVDNLTTNLKHDDDLRVLFKTMRLRRVIEYADRELYDKWYKGFGYTLDVINEVAKGCKTGGIKKLDALMCEYHKIGAFDVKEIASYEQNKQALFELAKTVTKNLGVYYQSLDVVVDEYVCKWTQLGFDADTLAMLAKYCFRNNVRTLSGLDGTVEKFYKMGLTTLDGIDQYVRSVVAHDKAIKNLLEKAGLVRNVTASDRRLYKTWTEGWLMSTQLIELAVEKSAAASNPLQYANKVLATYKENGVSTVEQAQKLAVATLPQATQGAKKPSFEQHDYTDDEINALFTDLENLEI